MKKKQPENFNHKNSSPLCPLCERLIPPSQADKHHLVPKSKGGRVTEVLHRACHRQIHMLFTEAELAKHYSTADDLLQNESVQKFVAWIKSKPIEFMPQITPSRRIRKN